MDTKNRGLLGRVWAIAGVVILISSACGKAAAPIAILDSARTSTYFGLAYGYCQAGTADPNALGSLEYKRYWGGGDLPGDFDTSRSERESHEGGI